ncbi:MAG: cyclic pyranopterin monophosphate synthase MoaC [Actinomycetia bacterium]|nr:cyclic pyranopterin monophosphate synthase MoaC [Actinomycetes bacterium]
MVDVAGKGVSTRTATATAVVRTSATDQIRDDQVAKGDVCGTARIAGIMAAKRTGDLIPLCHPIALHQVVVSVAPATNSDAVQISATVKTADRTGVEMEALTAVTVAGLTVIDMVKAVDRFATLTDVMVTHKAGGRSGTWSR